MFIGASCPAYAVAYFLPIMIRGMGFSVGLSQCLTAPPGVAAFIFGISMAALGDRMRQRGIIIVAQSIITIIGLALVGWGNSFPVRYFGMFLTTMGGSANIPAVLSYQSNNIRLQSKRSVGSALQVWPLLCVELLVSFDIPLSSRRVGVSEIRKAGGERP